MRCVGIDYSMTSPAMCIWDGDGPPEFVGCEVHFLTDLKKCVGFYSNMSGWQMPEWSTPEERFDLISDAFLRHLRESDRVVLEGYAFAAKGQVYQIGENGGLLKHKLYRKGIWFDVVAPSVIKKHGTGKGNADKALMEQAFVTSQGVDLRKALSLTDRQQNPVSDIIDAFYMCSYCHALASADE